MKDTCYSLSRDSIHRGNLILVNSGHGYQGSETPDLLSLWGPDPSIRLRPDAASQLMGLTEKISGRDRILPVSGWRSLQEQKKIWDDSLKEHGLEFTRKYVAYPGHSEHQTGLAIDLAIRQEKIDFICPKFPYEGICQDFRRHAAGFGFVERYPAGKETVTGIGHEPWHFRYVGIPHSLIMEDYHFALEEYTDFLRDYPCGRHPFHYTACGSDFSVSCLKAGQGEYTYLETGTDEPFSVSGNNVDGFIITKRR